MPDAGERMKSVAGRVAKWRAAFQEEATEKRAVTLPAPWPLIRDLWEMLEDATDEIAVLREAGREQDRGLRDMEATVKMQHRAIRDAR